MPSSRSRKTARQGRLQQEYPLPKYNDPAEKEWAKAQYINEVTWSNQQNEHDAKLIAELVQKNIEREEYNVVVTSWDLDASNGITLPTFSNKWTHVKVNDCVLASFVPNVLDTHSTLTFREYSGPGGSEYAELNAKLPSGNYDARLLVNALQSKMNEVSIYGRKYEVNYDPVRYMIRIKAMAQDGSPRKITIVKTPFSHDILGFEPNDGNDSNEWKDYPNGIATGDRNFDLSGTTVALLMSNLVPLNGTIYGKNNEQCLSAVLLTSPYASVNYHRPSHQWMNLASPLTSNRLELYWIDGKTRIPLETGSDKHARWVVSLSFY